MEELAGLGPGLMSLGLFVVSEDKVVGRLFMECKEGKDGEALAASLQTIKIKLKEKAAPRGLTLTGRVKKEKGGVTAKVQLSGLGQAISQFWMENLKKQDERKR